MTQSVRELIIITLTRIVQTIGYSSIRRPRTLKTGGYRYHGSDVTLRGYYSKSTAHA